MRTRSLPLVPVLALVVATGCAKFSSVGQDVAIRHEPELDRIDVLVVSRGMGYPEGAHERTRDAARDRLAAILARRPQLGFGDWGLLLVDLADLAEDEDVGPADRDLVAGVQVTEAKAFLDAEDRLGWYQRFAVPRAGRVVERVNELLSESVAGQLEDTRFTPDSPYAATRRILLEAARSDWRWLAFDDGALVLRIPTDGPGAAAVLKELTAVRGEDAPLLTSLLEPLSSLQVTDSHAELRLTPDATGAIRWTFDYAHEYDDALREDLATSSPLRIDATLSLDEARAFPRPVRGADAERER